jgi:site-specific recombinase XerD
VVFTPQLSRTAREGGGVRYELGHELIDAFLEFCSGRARPNTVRAYAHDLKTFFSIVAKDPIDVTPADVIKFVTAQQMARPGAENVVRFPDASSGLAPATVMRRLAAVSAFYGYLLARADTPIETNPVPRGLPTRRNRRELRGAPLVRGVRRLPRILDPEEAIALLAALRTRRDRAIVEAMLLGGLRRSEVLGLRLEDIRLGECRVFVAEGKGGHERLVPLSPTFFSTLASYLECERPEEATTDRVFVVLKGPRRGGPLSTEGLDEVITSARRRAGLAHGTCHELRHTCLTRLREAGMSLEALQAQAGHRSIASTQIYLHLGADWLAAEYRRAADLLEAELVAGVIR